MPRKLPRASWYAVFLATSVFGRTARAGNLDAFYLSGDAALQGGAITADARGGGAAWYNPAGLAELRGLRVDVSVNGYSVRFGGNADFDSSDPNAQVTRLSHLDLNVVPTALTLTRDFGDIGFAFGIFVPTQSVTSLRTQLSVKAPDQVDFAFDTYNRYQEYHVGPSIGWKPNSELNLGASLLVNYRTSVSTSDLLIAVGSGENSTVSSSHQVADWIQVGAEFVFGAQWSFAPHWRLGAVVRTPALRLGQDLQTIATGVSAEAGSPPTSQAVFGQDRSLDAAFIAPARVHAGLSHDIADVRLSADLSMQMPLSDPALNIELRSTPNARLGFRRRLSQVFAYGGGIFTDRSPFDVPRQFGSSRIDYYGLTGSVAFATPYGVVSRGGEVYPETRTMLFETTLALSYALGIGSLMRAQVAGDQSEGISYQNVLSEVTAHEFSLHIGTTVME